MQEMRRFPGANFPEFAALHFGIRNLRVSIDDKLARWPINQRFPSDACQIFPVKVEDAGRYEWGWWRISS